MRLAIAGIWMLTATLVATAQGKAPSEPKSLDPRLEIVLFAAAPDIVHPVAAEFDSKGRLLVIESHTHFAPKDYKGPKHDRIRVLEDTDGDGKADKFTTFHEGTRHTMDLARHPDGSIYVATRNEILRLRDTDGDGRADESKRIVFLDTKGNYPHNGLSGLCFDEKGNLYFGMGENLGVPFKLSGSDGTTIASDEGGYILHCTADGKNLRKVAKGFWNPFGICRDVFGRVFAVDNDPDAMPPCRLVHVVEGGDYGYQFRYGRSGRHPFQSWNGELFGTLPYVAGVGEAPSEVLAYESDNLPNDYLGTLLVTSWADHRLECYPLENRGASFSAKKKVVIQGNNDFRPVGLTVAGDGSLFMTDWVKRDYNLHGHGAVWHVRAKKAEKRPMRRNFLSMHRDDRDAEARVMAKTPDGIAMLQKNLDNANERVRVGCLDALVTENAISTKELNRIADDDISREVRVRAVNALAERARREPEARPFRFTEPKFKNNDPYLRAAAFAGYRARLTPEMLDEPDPFVRQAIVTAAAKDPTMVIQAPSPKLTDRANTSLLLIHRQTDHPESRKLIPQFFALPIDDVKFLTARWISDERIKDSGVDFAQAMKDPAVNSRLYMAYGTAQARLNGEQVNEIRLADIFLRRAMDEKASPASRVFSLRMVPTSWGGLQTEQLVKWTNDPSPEMRLEAVRALNDQSGAKRNAALLELTKNLKLDVAVRREAIVGLADQAEVHRELLLDFAKDRDFSADALRGLTNVKITEKDRATLESMAEKTIAEAEATKTLLELITVRESVSSIQRVLGRPVQTKEEKVDVDAWLKKLEGPADPDAGRRVFFHPRLAGCSKCHRVDGRGKDVGPDLSTIGQRDRKFILESILLPSREVAPHYQPWHIETADGKARTGLLSRTNLDETDYIDEKGATFRVRVPDIVESRTLPTSIMPDGLAMTMTDQEIRDLLAYLTSRK